MDKQTDSTGKFRRQCQSSWTTSGSGSAQLTIDDSELKAAVRVIWSLGPRSLYEMLRELRDGAEVAPTVRRYVGLQRFVRILNAHDGRRLRP